MDTGIGCSTGAQLKMETNPSKIIARYGSLRLQESAGSFFPARRARPSDSLASILSVEEHLLLQRRKFRRHLLPRQSCAWSARPRHGEGLRLRSHRESPRNATLFP